MIIDSGITINTLEKQLASYWKLAKSKVILLNDKYDYSKGSPVVTINGQYTSRGWTEWTQGFQYGIPLLIAEAVGDEDMLRFGKQKTIANMDHHLSHFGVHDHGFNNMSTYGNLLRLANQDKFKASKEEKKFYRLALSMSGSVQAKRWSRVQGGGFIYSFNGPHSLFVDTIRTCRILLAAHKLGHRMLDENDKEINLLKRVIIHGMTTAKYSVYYGEGRDIYDVSGRVAHESIFNMNDGEYRCPNTQQGYSGFTTWTRGLAWAMVGFTEILEFLIKEKIKFDGIEKVKETFFRAAKSTCDFYINHTSSDGIPYWDTGASKIHKLGDYQNRPAEIYNDYEPIDSSAAAIGAQGLMRLGQLLIDVDRDASVKYSKAGLTVIKTLLGKDYLALDPMHQGILRHSIYHNPNGWDQIPKGKKVPADESSMWGDYHMTELCLLVQKMINGKYYTFFEHLS
ncbi:glycoside hydrolase family 88 protein [Aestuariivivens sediminis]|uniref:glycoside hydrolase family 88 protein n=1 Tax=Aestuariivivens sediminis TaxID=2913557 RepID=UPI001F58E432|nr:glycoside hydrolase family 88 protein [Aestuariivivens sediminis]